MANTTEMKHHTLKARYTVNTMMCMLKHAESDAERLGLLNEYRDGYFEVTE